MNYVTFCRFEPDTFSPVVNRRAGRWRVVDSYEIYYRLDRPKVIRPYIESVDPLLCIETTRPYHAGVLINPAKAIAKKVVDNV